ncbi:MAG: tRNA glutamyl-Q(34) synthetase GluQRS [Pseudomonadota bacterium]
MTFRTRFAPSPTGGLHLGHVFSAVSVRKAADQAGGEALLRIEDTDIGRCRPEYEVAILDDLHWLGLRWDGPVRRQSEHFAAYRAVVDQLAARGLAYRCFKTRAEIAAETGGDADAPFNGQPLPADEEAHRLATRDPFAWRLSVNKALATLSPRRTPLSFMVQNGEKLFEYRAEPEQFGDVALTRKDSPVSYHLAACHDDAVQGITHVIRGEDLVDAPHIHVLLQTLMGWPTPIYRHHPLLLGRDGKRLSKRDRSKTIAALRQEGRAPQDVLAMAGVSL